MYRCLTAAFVLLVAGCATATHRKDDPSASEVERRLVESGNFDRVEANSPRGWYWLVGPPIGLLDAAGKSDPDFRVEGDRIEPVRLDGEEDPAAFVEFPDEPDGLEWTGERHLYMVEYDVSGVSYALRSREAIWGAPEISTGQPDTAEPDSILLLQSANYITDIAKSFIMAREFMKDGKKRLAWWRQDGEPTQEDRVLIRCRYFDATSPEWPAITRALKRTETADPEQRRQAAGRAIFHDLGLRAD